MEFFYPILDALNDGRVIRRSVAIILRVLGALTVLGHLLLVVVLLKAGFNSYMPLEFTLASVVISLLYLGQGFLQLQIAFYRARSVDKLEEGPFAVTPILSILFRFLGESMALGCVTLGLAGCISCWIGGHMMRMLPGGDLLRMDSTFLAGIFALVFLAGMAFVLLLFFYFLAEGSLVFVDMAKNLRVLAGKGNAKAPNACPDCRVELEPGAGFCGNCGRKV